jgi:hypothetical protein
MSINPIAGVGPVQGHSPAPAAAKPEAGEAPGAPDHDTDADNSGTPPAARAGAAALPGTLNVKA